ncbi:MAG TPA: protein kinase [Gemmatimonadaceae bacterium]|nr:protein kinase [Gemmatimonadaceae bacterium]
MNAQRWEEIQASFDELVELNASDRAACLATLASTDPELHRALESLLRADAAATTDLRAIDTAFLFQSDRGPDPLGLTGRTIAHFDLREVLGAGGMGVVYRADDRRLGRVVALKFLLPHYSLDASAKTRFLREAHAAAALDHPNLCTVYEVGTSDDGWLFLAMALYQGETLRARLTREGPVPARDALEIARQIAEGLQAAHTAGIVHRDLKPGNIMILPDGAVRILDFGLAKVRDQSASETGVRFGTVSYMSPEQIRGDNVDGRSDLWALGVVLYEMLTARKPFRGDEEVAIAHAILHDEPELPSTHRSDLSAALEGVVLRLLQKNPARRYVSAADLLRELSATRTLTDGTGGLMLTRWRRVRRTLRSTLRPGSPPLLFGMIGLGLLAAGYMALPTVRDPTNRETVSAVSSARSIAVVPFANLGGDSTNAPFSDGISDELATALGKVDQLSVMSRTSAFDLKRKGLDSREIGRQLHVQYILEGSVRKVANRRRVRADLIDVASGKEVWSDDFDNDALNRDVFTMEDSITRSIVRRVVPRISAMTMASLVKRPTESPVAHDLYLQGRYFFEKRDSASLAKAQNYFQRAIRSDPSYALAYAGLSDAYSLQATFGFVSPLGTFPKAKEYASHALALDSTLAEVHTSLAFIALFYDWKWSVAGREFETALRLNERYAPAHLFHAWYFMATDSINAAISEGRRAVDLDPFSALNNTRLVSFLFYGGRYSEALAQARKVVERDPDFAGVRLELVRVYIHLGRCPEALAVLEHAADAPMGLLRGQRGYTYAKCGHPAQAALELDRLRAQVRAGQYASHYAMAMIHAGLGDNNHAIAELEIAYTERAPAMFMMTLEPGFAGLHTDRRFVALAHKVGLTIPGNESGDPISTAHFSARPSGQSATSLSRQ